MEYKIEEYEGGFINDLSSDYGDSDMNALTYKIIGAAMEVYNKLGKGFSEIVYQDCLCIEFDERKMFYQREKKFDVIYKGIKIPHQYFADFIIETKVVLEVKASSMILEDHTKQVLN